MDAKLRLHHSTFYIFWFYSCRHCFNYHALYFVKKGTLSMVLNVTFTVEDSEIRLLSVHFRLKKLLPFYQHTILIFVRPITIKDE